MGVEVVPWHVRNRIRWNFDKMVWKIYIFFIFIIDKYWQCSSVEQTVFSFDQGRTTFSLPSHFSLPLLPCTAPFRHLIFPTWPNLCNLPLISILRPIRHIYPDFPLENIIKLFKVHSSTIRFWKKILDWWAGGQGRSCSYKQGGGGRVGSMLLFTFFAWMYVYEKNIIIFKSCWK